MIESVKKLVIMRIKKFKKNGENIIKGQLS